MKNKPIGVFDSGIGGLSVLQQFIRFLPYEKYIYLGDTARVPYGNKSTEVVRKYAHQCTGFLMEHDVKMIIVACNTVSAVALDIVREVSKVPVIGMIVPASLAALRATSNGKIGIIGTRATINSNSYPETIMQLNKSVKIKTYSQECPLFVPLVEEGWLKHDVTKMVASEYLQRLKKEEIDTLVLGCTHYPLLKQLINELMPGVNLIDSGEHSCVTAIRVLAEKDALAEERHEFILKPGIDFFVTDLPGTFEKATNMFLGFNVSEVHKISLE